MMASHARPKPLRLALLIAAAAPVASVALGEGPPAPSVAFREGAPPDVEARRLPGGHLLVKAEVNNRPGWFVFDTGAGANVLSTRIGEELALEKLGEAEVEGAGATGAAPVWLIDVVRLGPMTLRDDAFVGVDLRFLDDAWGVEVLGIVGYPLLERATVELDIATPRVALHDPHHPATFRGADLRWRDAKLVGGQLHVPARFEGHAGEFRVDTGSSSNGVIHSPTVRSLGLLDGRETAPASVGGVGGQTPLREGALARFTIWEQEYRDLPFNFSVAEEGAFASDLATGNIGAGILKDFLLILDYSRERYAVVKRPPAPAPRSDSSPHPPAQ